MAALITMVLLAVWAYLLIVVVSLLIMVVCSLVMARCGRFSISLLGRIRALPLRVGRTAIVWLLVISTLCWRGTVALLLPITGLTVTAAVIILTGHIV